MSKNESKKRNKGLIFSSEMTGMLLALFSIMGLLCLVTGEAVFFTVGSAVQKFLLGIFGFAAFPILLFFLFLGVRLVIGFKTRGGLKLFIGMFFVYLLLVGLIVQTATTSGKISGDFGEYISYCYFDETSSFGHTAGGMLFGLLAYPLCALLKPLGAYVLYGLAIILISVLVFKKRVKALFADLSERQARRADEKAEREIEKKQKELDKARQKAAARGLDNQTYGYLRTDNARSSDNFECSRWQAGVNAGFRAGGGTGAGDYNRDLPSGDYNRDYNRDLSRGEQVGMDNYAAEFSGSSANGAVEGLAELKNSYQSGGLDKIYGDEEFNLKTKKEMLHDDDRQTSLKLLFGERTRKTAENGVQNASLYGSDDRIGEPRREQIRNSSSYQNDYSGDMARKLDYIRRPVTPDYREPVKPPMGNDVPESVAIRNAERYGGIDDSAPERDVYVIGGNERGRERGRIRTFDEQSGRRSDSVSHGNIGDDGNDPQTRRYRIDQTENGSLSDRSGGLGDSRLGDSRFGERAAERLGGSRLGDSRRGDRFSERTSGAEFNYSEGYEDLGDSYSRSNPINATATDASESEANSIRGLREVRAGREFGGSNANGLSGERGNFPSNGERGENGASDLSGGFSGAGDLSDGVAASRENSRPSFLRDVQNSAATGDLTSTSASERFASVSRGEQIGMGPLTSTAKKPIAEGDRKLENPIDCMPVGYKYRFAPYNLMRDYRPDAAALAATKREQESRKAIILQVLANAGITAQIVDVKYGPALTRFELTIPPEVSIKKVTELQKDFNFRIAAQGTIRIVAPITGTSRIGIEVPNSSPATVGLKDLVTDAAFKNAKKSSLTFCLGKDLVGSPVNLDLSKMPHLLVAGATGTGKSVFLNTLLVSLMYKYTPEELRIILVDPKIVEFSLFKGTPNLLFDEIITETPKACAMLDWACKEMDDRYRLLNENLVKNVDEYNTFMQSKGGRPLYKILIIIDEFADLMATSADKKNIENKISRIAAKARAAGIHLIMATQRPSVDIMEGSIKTNFTSRVAFKMSSPTDAQVIMGEIGAEKLLGRGDVLYRTSSMMSTERAQGAFIDTPEIDAVCRYLREHNKCYYNEFALDEINKAFEKAEAADSASATENLGGETSDGNNKSDEEIVKNAMRLAINMKNISISMMQRRLGLGYPRAGKIMDILVDRKYVSDSLNSRNREINMTKQDFEQVFGEPFDPPAQ